MKKTQQIPLPFASPKTPTMPKHVELELRKLLELVLLHLVQQPTQKGELSHELD